MLDASGVSLSTISRANLQTNEQAFRRQTGSPERPAVAENQQQALASQRVQSFSTQDSLPARANDPLRTTGSESVEDNPESINRSAESALFKSQEEVAQAQEREQIKELARIDRDVRAHEAAHASVGGSLSGSPSFDFTRGPDGNLYATAGEVSIDTRPVSGDPEATIQKAQTIIQAALAPANPSSQDIQVAARAQGLLVEAQAELLALRDEAETQLSATDAEEQEEEEKETVDPNEPSAFEQNRDSIQERLQRSREQREEFAGQLQELNSRLNDFQQQLVDIGAIEALDPQGAFLDLVV
ncbi:putative metalloprotease CJM1_0395 family protein [Motiliproteus sp. MSK22-1]|uniref:putative metalloprotease CJM1_0395 family protein n=1 Tax=Motiliproteus sp. MSK22-1 TaxID=1897630 RepID=UPI000978C0FB|nr:putative metalloprotease CJM1_0395 family protein [Motiliproteus sp. MSK22-1]OMH38229.1 hypothetical protein BGP75_08235 [Motiliproteus sp. MSK22-1]